MTSATILTTRFPDFMRIGKTMAVKDSKKEQPKQENKEKEFNHKKFQDNLKEAVEKNKLITKVDDLIAGHLYEQVLSLMKTGYRLTQEQTQTLSDILFIDIQNNNYEELEKWINNGWKLTEKQSLNLLFNEKFQVNEGQKLFSYQTLENLPALGQQIAKFIQNPQFQQEYFKAWLEQITLNEDLPFNSKENILYPLYNNHEYLFKHIQSLTDFTELSKILGDSFLKNSFLEPEEKHIINQNIDFLNNIAKQKFENETQTLTYQAHRYNFDDSLSKTIESKIPNNIDIKELPIELYQHVIEISSLHKYIEPYFSKLKQNKQEEINNVISNTLPELLYHYLIVPDNYRQSLYNKDGKNLEAITTQGLLNIKNNLKNLVNNIEKHKHIHINTDSQKEELLTAIKLNH